MASCAELAISSKPEDTNHERMIILDASFRRKVSITFINQYGIREEGVGNGESMRVLHLGRNHIRLLTFMILGVMKEFITTQVI
jgi:hypothetical protein